MLRAGVSRVLYAHKPLESESQRLVPERDTKEEVRPVTPTISREDLLLAKLDRGDDFILVETLAEEHYHHAHLPSAVNAPRAPQRTGTRDSARQKRGDSGLLRKR